LLESADKQQGFFGSKTGAILGSQLNLGPH